MAVLNYFEKGLEMSYRVLPKSSAWVTKSVCDVFAYPPPILKVNCGWFFMVPGGFSWFFIVPGCVLMFFSRVRVGFHGFSWF